MISHVQGGGSGMKRWILLGLLILSSTACIALEAVSAVAPQCLTVTIQPDAQQIVSNMRQMSADATELSFMQSTIRMDAGAIGMSEQAIARATHPELRRFAQRVVNERSSEQEKFVNWILTLYGDGTYSASRLIGQDSLTIARFDQCTYGFEVGYMLAMIAHDAGVLAVAGEARQRSSHGRIEQAALKIADRRLSDIAQLRNWLACWFGIRVSLVDSHCVQC